MPEIVYTSIKGWNALSQRERSALLAILSGTSFSGAAVANGLNPSRLRKHNAKFMTALWHAQKLQQQAAQRSDAKAPASSDEGLSIYEQAAAILKDREARGVCISCDANPCKCPPRPTAPPAEPVTEGPKAGSPAVETPKVELPPRPEEPTEPALPSLAYRAAIATALVHDFWQRERARETERPRQANWMDDGLNCFR